ncbi:MAG TPA: MFS transporter [Terriglobales bacterium]|nr:MFS transporter [Terriglobales bacterium]
MTPAPIATKEARRPRTISGLRWWMIGMVFAATAINYVDRQCLALLAPQITRELNISNQQYGYIGVALLLAYAVSQTLSGRLYDRIGTRKGFSVSIVIWSIAAMAHSLASGVRSFIACQATLGLGEAGNWPGAAKASAEWFPIRERALAMAIFNSGASFGAVIAPPLVIWLNILYGWKATFVITGALGFLWLIAWWFLYRRPSEHSSISREELNYILEGQKVAGSTASSTASPKWLELFRYKQVWAIVLARLCVDPVWWLFVIWLPKYLADARGFNMKAIGASAWVPYLFAGLGSLTGGYLAGRLIRSGWSVNRARKTLIGVAACVMPVGIFVTQVESPFLALAFISMELFAFQTWISNVQTLPSDFFSDRTVASVAGLGGTGAAIGSMIFTFATGWVVQRFSYSPILITAGVLAPIGTVLLFSLSGKIDRVNLKPGRNS